ncbi:MAG: FtsQ-type POTRA domain-containing protein [Desulfobacterales bacterium]|nr:FtsQ-type POTRA domain-containing protein [Desulfobacterales bacterium]
MSADKRKTARKNRRVKPTATQLAQKRKKRIRLLTGAGVLIFTALFSVLSVLTYAWMTQTPMFSARFVMVAGNKHLTSTQVMDASDIQSGDNIFGVNLELAQARLIAHPWVDTASVIREFPNRIVIRVTEHQPAAIVELGRLYYINPRGELFARASEKKSGLALFKGVPRGSLPVSGLTPPVAIPKTERQEKIFRAVKELLPLLKQSEQSPSRIAVTAAQVDPDKGLDLITTGAAKRIKLGYGNYREKMDRVNQMFTFLEKKMRSETQEFKLNAVESVDVRDMDSVVIKPATS